MGKDEETEFRKPELLDDILQETEELIKIFVTNIDELVKSRKTPFFVIPAKAGIQFFQLVKEFLDSGFHRSDDFLRNHQY